MRNSSIAALREEKYFDRSIDRDGASLTAIKELLCCVPLAAKGMVVDVTTSTEVMAKDQLILFILQLWATARLRVLNGTNIVVRTCTLINVQSSPCTRRPPGHGADAPSHVTLIGEAGYRADFAEAEIAVS